MSLQKKRLEAGLSQSRLATVSGVNIRTIQAYEAGKRNINGADIKVIYKLASCLKCNVLDILNYDAELYQLLKEVHNGT